MNLMKKTLLILYACLFGALSGVKAYTVDDLTTAGWTLATNLDDITSNVYVLVDAGAQETAVVRGAEQATRPRYNTLCNPFLNKQEVWTIEKYGANYAILGIEDNYYFSSGDAGWNDGITNVVDGNKGLFTFNLSGEKYDIRSVAVTGDNNYMGHWNNKGEGVNISDNDDWSQGDGMEDIAVNKAYSNAPGYRLYKMAKSGYLQEYLRQNTNVEAPINISYFIVNSKIYQVYNNNQMPDGWSDYDVDSEDRTEGTGDTKLKGWDNSTIKTLKLDYFQTIASLPGGLYNITAATRDNKNHGKLKVYIYHDDSKRRAESDAATSNEGDHKTSDLALDGGSTVNIGIRTDGNSENSTVTGDNFRMSVDPYLSSMAAELPANGAMTAGLWYHFTVANTGNHILTATTLNDIIYATGNTTALSDAGSNKFSAIQSLTAGTDYYVRSSTDNTLTMKPCISAVATELPANGAMAAGNWFYFDIATGGHYDVVATTLANIVYTTDGNLAEDAIVESHFSVKNNELTATRYYVKSSSAQTLQWYLTDEQNYNSRMSFAVDDWTGVGQQTPKQVYSQNTTEGVETYNSNDVGFNSGNVLYQTISNLPNGNYEVSFYAWENFCDWNPSAAIAYGSGIAQVFANAATKDIEVINSRVSSGWVDANKYTLNCHVTEGTLIYGVKNIATGGNWAVCRPISLTYVGPYNEVIEDEEAHIQAYEGAFTEEVEVKPTLACPFVDITGASFTDEIYVSLGQNHNGLIYATPAQIATIKTTMGKTVIPNVISNDGNVCENLVIEDGYPFFAPPSSNIHATEATYSRDINVASNFGTICLPYAVESNKDIQYYTTEEITDGGVLKLTEVASVAAGTPAIFKKASASATKITAAANDVALTRTAGQAGVEVKLVGTFEDITVGDKDSDTGVALNQYYIKNNEFCQGVDNFNVKAFRAYINSEINAGARLIVRTDEETAINELKTLDEKQGLKDGKYLIDGKVIVVKNGNQFNVNGVLK